MKFIRQKTLLIALLVGMLAIHAVLFWNGLHLARHGYSDFTIFYTAGRIVRLGLAHHLYDDALQYRIQQTFAPGVSIRKGPLPYNHPAFEALLIVPFTFLNYSTAYVLWDLINLGILIVFPLLLRPHLPLLRRSVLLWLLMLLAFFPILVILLQGQDVAFLLLVYALAFVALRKNSDIVAGYWLGMGTFKFHLVVPLVLILACWKRNKAVVSFLVTAAILAAISIGVTGWAEALRYPEYVLQVENVRGHGAIVPADMPNLRGLLEGWPLGRAFPEPLHVLILGLSICLLLWVIARTSSNGRSKQRFDLQFSLAVVGTVLLSYHALGYDLVLLMIPILLLLNYASERGRTRLRNNMALWLPLGLLFCTPLYMLLWFRLNHLNVLAAFLLLWLWGIEHEMRTAGAVTEAQSS